MTKWVRQKAAPPPFPPLSNCLEKYSACVPSKVWRKVFRKLLFLKVNCSQTHTRPHNWKTSCRAWRPLWLTCEVRGQDGEGGGCWQLVGAPFGSSETGSSAPASAHYSSGPAASSWSITATDKQWRWSKHISAVGLLVFLEMQFFRFESNQQHDSPPPPVLFNIIILFLCRRCILFLSESLCCCRVWNSSSPLYLVNSESITFYFWDQNMKIKRPRRATRAKQEQSQKNDFGVNGDVYGSLDACRTVLYTLQQHAEKLNFTVCSQWLNVISHGEWWVCIMRRSKVKHKKSCVRQIGICCSLMLVWLYWRVKPLHDPFLWEVIQWNSLRICSISTLY